MQNRIALTGNLGPDDEEKKLVAECERATMVITNMLNLWGVYNHDVYRLACQTLAANSAALLRKLDAREAKTE